MTYSPSGRRRHVALLYDAADEGRLRPGELLARLQERAGAGQRGVGERERRDQRRNRNQPRHGPSLETGVCRRARLCSEDPIASPSGRGSRLRLAGADQYRAGRSGRSRPAVLRGRARDDRFHQRVPGCRPCLRRRDPERRQDRGGGGFDLFEPVRLRARPLPPGWFLGQLVWGRRHEADRLRPERREGLRRGAPERRQDRRCRATPPARPAFATATSRLARFNADGTPDESFSGDGKQTTDFGASSDDRAVDVVLQSDGKIVVVGTAAPGVRISRSPATTRTASSTTRSRAMACRRQTLAGLTPQAALRSKPTARSWSQVESALAPPAVIMRSLVTTRTASSTARSRTMASRRLTSVPATPASDLAIQSDGKLVVAGLRALRYLPDGTPDASFSGDGHQVTELVYPLRRCRSRVTVGS